jgi:TRAP-type mannitol/chloroaromatic compound transport system permease small subunit
MQNLADMLHKITLALCIALFAIMFAGQVTIVLMRYVMHVGFLELQDAVIYSFSCLVVLTIPLAMRNNRHVRVDIMRSDISERTARRLDKLGHLVFTIPVFALIARDGWPLISSSWAIAEGSRETGGLPGLFVVKATLLVMCLLVVLQAVAELLAGGRASSGYGDRS